MIFNLIFEKQNLLVSLLYLFLEQDILIFLIFEWIELKWQFINFVILSGKLIFRLLFEGS